MRINQKENGNITIKNEKGKILHILPKMYVHKHPRKSNAILITSDTNYKEEQKGITILIDKPIYINDTFYQLNVNELLNTLNDSIIMQGRGELEKAEPKVKEEDPNYVAFLQANTFEKLLSFITEHRINIGGQKFQDNKLIEEEFYCQFTTFIIRVNLRYYYKNNNQNLIDYILMFGNTEQVFKPKKIFTYDENNRVTGYIYEEVIPNFNV